MSAGWAPKHELFETLIFFFFFDFSFDFHLPNDSTLLSSCVFRFRVSLLLAAITIWRCFCAGNDAHRFNLVPPFTAMVPPPQPAFGVRIRLTLVVPCISLCDTERWTFRKMKRFTH